VVSFQSASPVRAAGRETLPEEIRLLALIEKDANDPGWDEGLPGELHEIFMEPWAFPTWEYEQDSCGPACHLHSNDVPRLLHHGSFAVLALLATAGPLPPRGSGPLLWWIRHLYLRRKGRKTKRTKPPLKDPEIPVRLPYRSTPCPRNRYCSSGTISSWALITSPRFPLVVSGPGARAEMLLDVAPP
jgi:hypothetical protein